MAGDKIMEARRAKFERKFPLLYGMYWCEDRNQYAGNNLFWLYQDRWECWNAALDSLCVEMPVPMECDDGYPSDDWLEANAQSRTVAQCREAIHAAGVKTK